MASTRPRSSIGADRGGRSKPSSSRRWNGWTGSTTGGSWSPSATSRRPKPSNATTPCWNNQPWRRDSNQIASEEPGAVQYGGYSKFEARIKELIENLPDLAVLVEPLLVVRRVLREQIGILHRRLLVIVRDDAVCRRLMTVPGVGPVVALTYRATVDVPGRFRNSKAVGAVFGLTPSKYQSGEINRTGAISKCGDEMMRVMLYEAAQVMLTRTNKWSWLKAWAMKIARHRGMRKAIVALARRLAVILHRIWVDGTEFRWTREVAAA